ncbi:mandelate racemase/muconate lactonizing enzyme family protein [Croceicoccus sediminis]|uniref:mandelate racemase/muconate lactonizing enzyme family protein n=1 Tax=Croceicoccus sediminis TaxID=2571150 RepID=UPI0011839E29|nr:mandelate racemase/muconate lactonizing enzyme family protein [Croceicoccus sediminis]
MKITDFRLDTYVMKMDRLVGDANLPDGTEMMPGAILRIGTDEGLEGISLGFGTGIAELFPAIEGCDPRDTVHLWKRIRDWLHKAGNEGMASLSFSAIDAALWDLKAKIAGVPLWQLLGGREGRVKAYASGLDYCLSDEDLFRFYRRMAERGVGAGKLKVGLDLKADMRRIGIMQEALSIASDKPELMIDANEYWSARHAIRWMARIEEKFDIVWVEEPAARHDYLGLRQVSDSIRASVASAENLKSLEQVSPLLANRSASILNLSANHSGVTGCRQIAQAAHGFGVSVSMMNCQANFMAHVAAALPNHTMMEVVDPGREHCLTFDNWIEDGHIVMGEAPGFGIGVREDVLAMLQADPPQGKGKFPFPRREGAGLYIVPPQPGEVPWATTQPEE